MQASTCYWVYRNMLCGCVDGNSVHAVYPNRYAQGCVRSCFVVIMSSKCNLLIYPYSSSMFHGNNRMAVTKTWMICVKSTSTKRKQQTRQSLTVCIFRRLHPISYTLQGLFVKRFHHLGMLVQGSISWEINAIFVWLIVEMFIYPVAA